jgi:hypothetical protein
MRLFIAVSHIDDILVQEPDLIHSYERMIYTSRGYHGKKMGIFICRRGWKK